MCCSIEVMADKKKVRVRIAPSPTGLLHVGTARTALFNYLFAKKNNGDFILRIEDTDKERSEKKYEEDIVESLKWLGLAWDEGPVRQSERTEVYKKYLEKLLEGGHAYWCFCTKDDLEAQRESQMTNGHAPKYSGHCREVSLDEAEKRLGSGKDAVLRFKVQEKEILVKDVVRGKVQFDTSLLGDFVIAKSFDEPLYNFAAVIDDHEMNITHVIRGEDHLANTPKQILIQEALGFDRSEYAHLPLILAPDKSKLSKRVGDLDATIQSLKKHGYMPEAVLNFLLLLGWNPGDEKEAFSLEESVKKFDFKKVQKGGAIFNEEKLNWFNSHYIREADIGRLANMAKEFVPKEFADSSMFEKALEIERERMKWLTDFEELAGLFFKLPDYPASKLKWKTSDVKTAGKHLEKVLGIMEESLGNGLEGRVMGYADAEGRGDVLWPLRVALSGQEKSPGPFEIIEVIGREEAIGRVKEAIKKISK